MLLQHVHLRVYSTLIIVYYYIILLLLHIIVLNLKLLFESCTNRLIPVVFLRR